MSKVFANGRSILHAGDGNTHVAAPPDVCKTPSPGGPVPIPYVNVAADRDLAKGTKKVKVEGKSAAIASSNLSTSVGDEPGTAGGGLISSKTKGKLTWATSSGDVKFEGKGVVRFMDVTQHNGNTFNSAFTSMGGTGLAYADDFEGPCQICTKGPDVHRVMETGEVAGRATRLLQELDRGFRSATDDEGRARFARLNDSGSWTGYMIGVMACKHDPPQYFAAHSGPPNMPGFAEAAEAAGLTPLNAAQLARANTQDFIKANQSNYSRGRKEEKIQAAFKSVKSSISAGRSGFNGPGTCAGAKLISKADGHAPRTMSEMFYEPPPAATWEGVYKVLSTSDRAARPSKRNLAKAPGWVTRVLQNRKAKKRKHKFSAGESVASCHSCQEILFLTMCPERNCV